MHKYERDELRRIIKGRFEVLHAQLMQRESEIRAMVRQRIESEYDQKIKRMDAKIEKLNDKYQKLSDEAKALLEEGRELGLKPRLGSLRNIAEGGRVLTGDWQIIDEDKQVNAALTELRNEAGMAGLNLRYEELKFYEELASDALETEESKKFFDRIPTVDDVLPLPTAAKVKEIVS